MNLSGVSAQPVYNVLSQLVYAAGGDQVTDTYVAGRALLRDGVLTTLNESAVLAKAEAWRMKIKP